ncbi:MAG: LD-carboxypeptidase [Erysipelotrichaceae bacterium]|nr:LD-carboxypeptidase [Erysipelotrichaceae bacterium]
MKYPQFVQTKDTIGICAPSAGVGKKIEDYENSLSVLKKEGFEIRETASVRAFGDRSASARVRAKELDELVCDENVKMIVCAAGGDYMMEILPYVHFEHILAHPKWIMGYSDPTNLLFPLTTKYDLATIYGFNAGYAGKGERYERDNLRIIKGDLRKQQSYRKYRSFLENIEGKTAYTHDVRWVSKDVVLKGRIIGGCFDVIAALMGTPYDGTSDFIERYRDDGILWYFDNFAFDSLQTYLTLLEMKYAGYFRHCSGVIFGRSAFPHENGISYAEAYRRIFRNIPIIREADIGHTDPHMTIINGALAEVRCHDGKGSISFFLK